MSSHASRSISALAVAGLFLCTAAPSWGESDAAGSAIRFFLQQRQQSEMPTGSIAHGGTGVRAPRSASAPRIPAGPRSPRALAAVVPRKVPALSVAVYGDRFAQALVKGLEDDAGDWLAVTSDTGEDAGLARADFADWLQSLRSRLLKPDQPPVALMMLGSNDRQALPDATTMVEPASPRWEGLYAARIDAVAAAFRDARVSLIWVGMPSVHGEEASASIVRLNALFRERAGKNGITFVDSWEAFSDENGQYSPMGPDVDGHLVKLRRADGFGFTRAGARKLASFVEGDIRRLEGPPASVAAPQVADITIEKAREFDSALDIDVNAQIRHEMGLAPDGSGLTGRPVSAPLGPVAGPVLPLMTPPLAPGGQLATASVSPTAASATLVVKASETTGDIVASRHGRTDDFAWPKP